MKFRLIAVKSIDLPEYKLRFKSGLMNIDSLVNSIERNGLICPLSVSPRKDRWKLIAGERRLIACKKLGWEKVPCAVLEEGGKDDDLIRSIDENLQRLNLTPLERALGFKELKETYGLTEKEIGARTGRTQSNISHHLRLLEKLHPRVLNYLHEGKITFGHAVVLMILKDKKAQLSIAKRVIEEGISIVRTRLLVDQERPSSEMTDREKNLNRIEKVVERAVGPDWWEKIDIKQGKKEEEIKIKFSEQDGLKSLLLKIAAAL